MDYPKGIRPDGAGLRIRLWQYGRPVYSETIPCDPTTKASVSAAEARRDWLKARLKLGLPLYEDEIRENQNFKQVRADYIETLDAKRSTKMSYTGILNRYWAVFDSTPADAITTADIKRVLHGYDVAGKTKRNALATLRAALAHVDVHPNPCDRVKIAKGQAPEIQRYLPDERTALLKALSGQAQVYFAVLFGCGLRPGEALGLEWIDYDGEQLSITKQIVRRRKQDTTKTSKRRKVYVPEWARPYLNNHPTRFEGGHIFQTEKGSPHLDTDVFNGAWKKAHKVARIPYRIPYTCRHSRAAELLSTGIEPADACQQLGHSVEMFLRTYSEWIDEYSNKRDNRRFEGVTAESTDEKKGKPAVGRINTGD